MIKVDCRFCLPLQGFEALERNHDVEAKAAVLNDSLSRTQLYYFSFDVVEHYLIVLVLSILNLLLFFLIRIFWGGRDMAPETVAARGHREREGPSRQAGKDSTGGA